MAPRRDAGEAQAQATAHTARYRPADRPPYCQTLSALCRAQGAHWVHSNQQQGARYPAGPQTPPLPPESALDSIARRPAPRLPPCTSHWVLSQLTLLCYALCYYLLSVAWTRW